MVDACITYERTKTLTAQVLAMLEDYDPAQVITKVYFRKSRSDKPMHAWSFTNQMISLSSYLLTHSDLTLSEAIDRMDYRCYKQWLDVGRKVIHGERAENYIFSPIVRKVIDKETEEEKFIIAGFTTKAVFEFEQTEGDDLPTPEQDSRMETVKYFNFLHIADIIGVKIQTAATGRGEYGYYNPDKRVITICTPEEMTYYHELSHAVDDYLLKERAGKGLKSGQHVDQEIVAQFCANVLAYISGKEVERTTAYTKQYITSYLSAEKLSVAVLELMSRINNVIDFIMVNSEYNKGS